MLELTLSDIMSPTIISATPDIATSKALELMAVRHISCLLVAEGTTPCGMLTERSIIIKALEGFQFAEQPLGEAMSTPVVSAPPDMGVRAACELIAEKGIRHLVVVDDAGEARGVITLSDIIDALSFEFFCSNAQVSQLMTSNIVTAPKTTPLREALQGMIDRLHSCLLVVNEHGFSCGVIVERDVAFRIIDGKTIDTATVANVMRAPLDSVPFNAPMDKVLMYMKRRRARRLVVTNSDRAIIGLLTQSNIVKAITRLDSES